MVSQLKIQFKQSKSDCVLQWWDPNEMLDRYNNKRIWLAPPQIYETHRLLNFKQFDLLQEFVKNRSDKGCERWLPVRMKCKDIFISVLPGE